jgi:hypothetical protein
MHPNFCIKLNFYVVSVWLYVLSRQLLVLSEWIKSHFMNASFRNKWTQDINIVYCGCTSTRIRNVYINIVLLLSPNFAAITTGGQRKPFEILAFVHSLSIWDRITKQRHVWWWGSNHTKTNLLYRETNQCTTLLITKL